MNMMRIPLLIVVLALAAVTLPASAADSLPDACAGRGGTIDIGPDEVLVERTSYFTSLGRVGNLDAQGSPYDVSTRDDEPTGDESKVMLSRPGSLGNAAVQGNYVNGFFTHELDSPTRVVCARVDLYVASSSGSLPVQFFVDGVEFSGSATGTSGPGTHYSGTVRRLDASGWDVIVQFNAGAPGAAIFYDSAEHPSSLTIVTVEQTG